MQVRAPGQQTHCATQGEMKFCAKAVFASRFSRLGFHDDFTSIALANRTSIYLALTTSTTTIPSSIGPQRDRALWHYIESVQPNKRESHSLLSCQPKRPVIPYGSGLALEAAQVCHTTHLAIRFPGLANIAAVQQQPMVGVAFPLIGNGFQ